MHLAGLAGTGFVMDMVSHHSIMARAQRQSLLADHNRIRNRNRNHNHNPYWFTMVVCILVSPYWYQYENRFYVLVGTHFTYWWGPMVSVLVYVLVSVLVYVLVFPYWFPYCSPGGYVLVYILNFFLNTPWWHVLVVGCKRADQYVNQVNVLNVLVSEPVWFSCQSQHFKPP